MSDQPVLELKGITKRFPGVLANDHINLTLNKGEVHALLGENGAGKSTLMNILYGLYQPTEGEIFVDGKKVDIHSPGDSIEAGIGMVHQHFMLIPVFTVTENVMLGEEETTPGGFLKRREAAKKIEELSGRFGLNVNPNAMVGDLPVGVQQRVEIIKLLYRDANILIFDEPTAVLTPQEADSLFEIMQLLIDQGKSIIFITHKLREVLDYADRITVLRRGKVVGSTTPAEANPAKLAEMMVGRAVDLDVERDPPKVGSVVLKVDNLTVMDEQSQVAVDQISFELREGEILGVAGIQGNGQTELVGAVTGMTQTSAGKITLLGKDIQNKPPRTITEMGSAHIPEDRQRDGVVSTFPIIDNLALQSYYTEPFSNGVVLNESNMRDNAAKLVEQFDVRTPSIETSVGSLSGGNQQKVIVAREFSRDIKFLVAAQPTRGIDVGSIEYIHSQIVEKRDDGVAVLLVSTELDEVMQLSDRIAVMFDGRITAMVNADDVTKEQVGLLMAGSSLEEVMANSGGEEDHD
ncbi:MAG: ABC transporter ATP-binding protein [Chloroflexota bacterium]